MRNVHETASGIGDVGVLSKADIEVLALALDLKKKGLSPAVVSDDYAIQNVSETLGIEHASLTTFGIARRFDWSVQGLWNPPQEEGHQKWTCDEKGRPQISEAAS
jgi:rRNA maturation endonuclease Nob1